MVAYDFGLLSAYSILTLVYLLLRFRPLLPFFCHLFYLSNTCISPLSSVPCKHTVTRHLHRDPFALLKRKRKEKRIRSGSNLPYQLISSNRSIVLLFSAEYIAFLSGGFFFWEKGTPRFDCYIIAVQRILQARTEQKRAPTGRPSNPIENKSFVIWNRSKEKKGKLLHENPARTGFQMGLEGYL